MNSTYIDGETGEVIQLGMVDMTNEEYHSAPGYSSSQVRRFSEASPLHYWWETYGKRDAAEEDDEEEAENEDLKFGTAVHAAVLEPDMFSATYLVAMPYDARTKAGKAYRDDLAQKCKAEGKIALHPKEHAACLAIAQRIRRHPVASGFFTGGRAEQSFFTLDKERGVVRKCRPDYLHDNGFALVDLKTAKSVNPTIFGADAARSGYHLAAPWYLDITEDLYGEAPKHFVWVAAEKKPPYAIGVFFAEQADIDAARTKMLGHFEHLIRCEKSGHWPDWGEEEVRPLRVPKWAL